MKAIVITFILTVISSLNLIALAEDGYTAHLRGKNQRCYWGKSFAKITLLEYYVVKTLLNDVLCHLYSHYCNKEI